MITTPGVLLQFHSAPVSDEDVAAFTAEIDKAKHSERRPWPVKSRGAIFRADMVLRLLDGTKTHTRRPFALRDLEPSDTPGYDWDFRDRRAHWNSVTTAQLLEWYHPFGKPGDYIYARETWAHDGTEPIEETITFRADWECKRDYPGVPCEHGPSRWRPAIHMPKRAARIVRRIEETRVEPLGAISEADARAEGFKDRAAFLAAFHGIYDIADTAPVSVTVFSAENDLSARSL